MDFYAAPSSTPNNGGGLQTLKDMMSLQLQKQALQSGQLSIEGQQSTNQSAAARASTDTRAASEQAKLAQIPWDSFEKDDGSFDVDGARKMALKVAPTTGAEFAQRLNDTAKGSAETKKAFGELATQQQQGIRSAIGSWGADPDAPLDALQQQADIAKANAPDATKGQVGKVVDHTMRALTGPDLLTGQTKTLAQQKAAAVAFSRAGLSNSEVSGPGGLATPQAASVNNGAQSLIGTTAPALAGGAFTPSTAVTHQLTPGERLPQAVTTPAGVVNRNPVSGALSAPTAAPNLNPTQAQALTRSAAASGVADRVNQAQVAANNTTGAQDALTRAKAILESSDSPSTGGGFANVKELKNLMSGLGIDTKGADDMNTLTKNLARYEAARATQSGLGGTDAARELAHAGSPNTSLDNKALLGVVRQSLATEKANAMYAGIQAKHSADPDAMAKNESDYRNIPHLIEAHEYAMMKTPQEASEFLKAHGLTAADMKAARDQIKEFGSR